jgi:hypothetical protein
MPLSLKQLQDVCMLYSGSSHRCRYISQDDTDPAKWYCLKKTSKKADIDDEVVEVLKELRKKGLDPRRQALPLGDNCDGYLPLKYLTQGYDIAST